MSTTQRWLITVALAVTWVVYATVTVSQLGTPGSGLGSLVTVVPATAIIVFLPRALQVLFGDRAAAEDDGDAGQAP